MRFSWFVTASLAVAVTIGIGQQALERQLAGVRLGAPVIAYDETGRLRSDCLLSIWGMPDYLAGPPTTGGQGGAGAPGMPGMPGAPTGAMPGAPFGGGGVGMGSSFGGQPTLPGVMAGVSGMAQLAGSPIGRPSLPGMPGMAPGGMPGMPESEAGMPGMPGMAPGGMPGMPGVGGATTGMPPRLWDLAWVFPPFVQVERNEVFFVYKRGAANLCFLVELMEDPRSGARMEVIGISVAGERFDGARTAMGDPFKSVKLGDEMGRVLLRYGQPDEIVYFNPVNLQIVPTPTGNVILRYHKSSNIEFTVYNGRVVRIFIFLRGRVTLTR